MAKKTISTENLCEIFSLEFATYFDLIRSRGFDDNSQYSYPRRIFRDLFVSEGIKYDRMFD